MKFGKVSLAGAGPGDVELLTLKTVKCLSEADVVVSDQLVNSEVFAFVRKGAEIIFAGKYAGTHVLVQKEINQLLIAKARAGKKVVRLKGGDPLLFGRGAEEAKALRAAKIPFEIVPGVSSAYSVPAYAGIPVTCRDISSRVNIVTGHESPDKGELTIHWAKIIDRHSTLVVLMGFNNLQKIVDDIGVNRKYRTMPVAVISNGTRWNQKVVTGTLSNIVARVKASGMKPPAIIVIGRVVKMRQHLEWFKPGPALAGKRILITRPEHQTSELKNLLESCGAKVTALPLIQVVPSKDTAGIREKLKALDRYHWLIVSSVNGVNFFLEALKTNKISVSALKGKKIAAIGSKTAERLEKAGIKVDLVPKDFVQESLAGAMIKAIAWSSSRVLLAHSSESRPVLEQRLKAAGLHVDTLNLYSTLPVVKNHTRVKAMFHRKKVDAVMLTSSSCADSFMSVFKGQSLKKAAQGVVIAAIGPITAETARRAGLPVAVESRESTIGGMTGALVEYYQGQERQGKA